MFHNHQPKDVELMDPKWFGIQTHLQLPGIPDTLFLPGKPSAGGPDPYLDASQEVAIPWLRVGGSCWY